MADEQRVVSVSADGCVVVRTGVCARRLGIEDPFAPWFVTDEGQRLVATAKSVDGVYEEFNAARFKFSTGRIREMVGITQQVVLLAAGFDCRGIWLDELKGGSVRVFEIDTPDKLSRKVRLLEGRGVLWPEWNSPIGADLNGDPAKNLLVENGYDPKLCSLVVAEGVLFFLPAETCRKVLDPAWLELSRGSSLLFDYWTPVRVETMNRRVRKILGVEIFQPPPFSVGVEGLESELRQLGYREVIIKPLDQIATRYFLQKVIDEHPGSWLMVEAIV